MNRPSGRALAVASAFALAACVRGFPAPQPRSQPLFDPIAFFAGRSAGEGRLKVVLRAPARFHVDGSGRIEGDGSLVLDQRIAREGHRPQRRQWRIRRAAAGGYAATLSSADGPVALAVSGNLLRLDFREDGLRVRQDVMLAPDGRSALNHLTWSKLGLRVAAAEERIVKRD